MPCRQQRRQPRTERAHAGLRRASEAAAKIEPPQNIVLKEHANWQLIGTPQRRFEVIDKVQGKPIYGIDVRLPNMLYAAIMHSPVFKGKLKLVDNFKLTGLSGTTRSSSSTMRSRWSPIPGGEQKKGSTRFR